MINISLPPLSILIFLLTLPLSPYSQPSAMTFIPEWAPFYHGVASGDPLDDRVIIWTRVTPGENEEGTIEVSWQMADDLEMENIVASGVLTTDHSRDYTVKVDVSGLEAGETYYYMFSALGKNSLIGRTKTTPVGDLSEHLRFGVVSCNNYQAGFFNAFQRLAERNDLDAIIHLGDYIYEYADGFKGDSTLFEIRKVEPEGEAISLADYRTRYSTYRLDTSLVRVHQQHPFIMVWDDHESANDAYIDGANNHSPATEGDWESRKAASKQAYFEWAPIRDTDDQRVYRSIRYGRLMDLILLDARLEGRQQKLANALDSALFDPERTLLGETQKNWLFDQLLASQARWKVIGQQVLFSEINIGAAALQDPSAGYYDIESRYLDIWDGYPAERSEIIQFIADEQLDNVVILSGDFHCSFACDIVDNPVDISFQSAPLAGEVPVYTTNDRYNPDTGEGAVAVEFVTPSVTSDNFDERFSLQSGEAVQILLNNEIDLGFINLGNPNPHFKYVDLIRHGYFIFNVQADSAQADWFFSPVEAINSVENTGESWYSKNGENHLKQADAPVSPKPEQDEPAPSKPFMSTEIDELKQPIQKFVLLGLYPNPVQESLTLHYSLNQSADLQITLYDKAGRLVKTIQNKRSPGGVFTRRIDTTRLPAGIYFLKIFVDNQSHSVRMIKGK